MVDKPNHRGFHEWIIQRVTAVFIGIYTLYLLAYLYYHHPLFYAQWHALFHHWAMKIATFVVLLSVLWHAWIGLWTVLTDYVKPLAVRLLFEILVCLLLLAYLAVGIDVLWG